MSTVWVGLTHARATEVLAMESESARIDAQAVFANQAEHVTTSVDALPAPHGTEYGDEDRIPERDPLPHDDVEVLLAEHGPRVAGEGRHSQLLRQSLSDFKGDDPILAHQIGLSAGSL